MGAEWELAEGDGEWPPCVGIGCDRAARWCCDHPLPEGPCNAPVCPHHAATRGWAVFCPAHGNRHRPLSARPHGAPPRLE